MLSFLPDADDITPEVLSAVSGIPTMRGYQAPPTAFDYTATQLGSGAVGGDIVMYGSGSSRILVATSSNVYEFGSDTFTNIGSLACNNTFFLGFGADVLVFNSTIKPQKVTASLTAINAPRCKAVDANKYFVMVGNTNDGGTGLSTSFGEQGNRWWCSPYANALADWNPSVTTQCASGLLADTPGDISGVRALGDRFAFYKQGALYLATYVGPPDVYVFERISDRIGAYSQRGVVKVDDVHYFIGSEDIWKFDGVRPVSIGSGVRDWFYASLDRASAAAIQGRHDPYNRLVYWHYPAAGGDGSKTKVLVYHYPTGRFGAFDLAVGHVFPTEGGQLFASTVDGTARQLSMSYLDASRYMKSLSAAGTLLTFTTAWYGDEQRVSLCDRVKPRFRTAPSSGTVTHSTCMHLGQTPVAGSAATLANGFAYLLMSGRYHRDAHSHSGDCEIQSNGANLIPEGSE